MWRLLFLEILTLLCLVEVENSYAQQLTATIHTVPDSPPYPAATWILFACEVDNAAAGSTVYYNWTVFCSRISPPLVIFELTDRTDIGELTLQVRSTPRAPACADMVVCSANDTAGNTASSTLLITEVTGVGLWGPAQPIITNSAYLADGSGDIGIIYCHSSSYDSNVGRWIAPSGEDITENHFDSFVVQFTNGPLIPSYSTLKLLNPFSDPFTTENEGVYSCMTPDENGNLQTVNVGLYTSNYSTILILSSAHRSSESPLTLNCVTTGLPPTVVEWRREGEALSTGSSYQMTRVITNRRNSSYDNMLTINLATDAATGFYECLAITLVDDSPSQTELKRSNLVRQTFVVSVVGSSERISCTLTGVFYVTWEDEDGNVLLDGFLVNSLLLELSANDSIHEKTYSCRGYGFSGTTVLKELRIKPIIIVPESVLLVTASSTDSAPVLGQQYTIDCLAAKTAGGLINLPTVQLALSNGTVLTSGVNGITLIERVVGTTAREVTMTAMVLYTSHAGSYTCRGSLQSPAKSSVIVKEEAFDITVRLPSPLTISLSSSDTSPTLLPGSSVTLQCTVTISTLIDTPVSVLFTWSKITGNTLTNNERITISQTQLVNTFTYKSTLTIDGLNRSLDSNAPIRCSARVIATTNEEHLLPSITITSGGYHINVVGIIIATHAVGSTRNGTYSLVCTVTEEQDINGVPTVNWIAPNGQTLETSGDITVTTQTPEPLTTVVTLHFNPLRASHGGEYTCRALLETVGFDETRTIDVVFDNLHVVIEPTGPGYEVGSSLQLTCRVAADSSVVPVGGLSYSWSSTCAGECFVSDQTTSSISQDVLRAVDSGTHTCMVTDSVGNFGHASIVVMVTGVALHHSELGLLVNNTVIQRSADDGFGTITCLSGSMTPNVGRWVAPNGVDLTQQVMGSLHPFQIVIGGDNNPGFVSLSVVEGMFDNVYQGVYSCVIPDEIGEMKIIHLGIHTSGVIPIPQITSLASSSHRLNSQFTLNCSSDNSAPTVVTWSRAGATISADSAGYQTIQLLRNGTTSTYDNLLLVSTTNPNELIGQYSCSVRNSFGQQQADVSLQGIAIVANNDVHSLDSMASFTCTSDLGVSSISWFFNDQLVTSSSGSEGVLTLQSISDSMHNNQYTCRATATFGTQEHTVNLLVEVDAERDLSIEITPSTDSPVSNDPFSITCTITKSVGLQNTPSIEWLDAMGNVLTTSDVGNLVTVGQTSHRTIQLNSFMKDLHQRFTCRSTIISSAPPFTLTKIAMWEYIETNVSCNFQLLLGKVDNCQQWAFQSAREKQNDIIAKLTTVIEQLCPSCVMNTLSFIDLEFSCPEDMVDEQFVLFRATISSSLQQQCEQTLQAITDWVKTGSASLLVLTNRLTVNLSCDVEIETRSSSLRCSSTTDPSTSSPIGGTSKSSSIGAAAGAGGGVAVVLLVAAVIIIVVLVICFLRIQKRKKLSRTVSVHLPVNHQAPSTVNEAYGMFSVFQNPYYSNSIKVPDLPPRNDLYATPRSVTSHTTSFSKERGDSYINVDPAKYAVVNDPGKETKNSGNAYSTQPDSKADSCHNENVYENIRDEEWLEGMKEIDEDQ